LPEVSGAGGWAYIAVLDDREVGRDSGAVRPPTTQNRMELVAAIAALSSIPAGAEAVVFADSTYVVKCFSERRRDDWEQRGWRIKNGKPVKNLDLWLELFALVRERSVTFEPIPVHAGHHWNEMADRLAVDLRKPPICGGLPRWSVPGSNR
jgi:ribonuclease HI